MNIDEKDYGNKEAIIVIVEKMFHGERQTAWNIEDEIINLGEAVREFRKKDNKKSLDKLLSERNTALAISDKPQGPTPVQQILLIPVKIELINQGYKCRLKK